MLLQVLVCLMCEERLWSQRGGIFVQFILGRNHFVGATRDIVITPFDDDSVAALLLDSVGDVIQLVTHVLDKHLLTGGVRPMHTHHQHVGT